GRAPENFDVAGKSLAPLKEPTVAPGLPAELLTRRPDIAAAEANLQAANANLAAARAAMLPSLTLTASGGVQNPVLPGTINTISGAGPSGAVRAGLGGLPDAARVAANALCRPGPVHAVQAGAPSQPGRALQGVGWRMERVIWNPCQRRRSVGRLAEPRRYGRGRERLPAHSGSRHRVPVFCRSPAVNRLRPHRRRRRRRQRR